MAPKHSTPHRTVHLRCDSIHSIHSITLHDIIHKPSRPHAKRTSAPLASSSSTTAQRPWVAAMWRGVRPSCMHPASGCEYACYASATSRRPFLATSRITNCLRLENKNTTAVTPGLIMHYKTIITVMYRLIIHCTPMAPILHVNAYHGSSKNGSSKKKVLGFRVTGFRVYGFRVKRYSAPDGPPSEDTACITCIIISTRPGGPCTAVSRSLSVCSNGGVTGGQSSHAPRQAVHHSHQNEYKTGGQPSHAPRQTGHCPSITMGRWKGSLRAAASSVSLA
jgi:hypothetical protein